MRTIEIDAEGKVLGRLASQIAMALRGKTNPDFRPDRLPEVTVIVKNATKFAVTGKKNEQKMYYHFSGYPGGLKKTQFKDMQRDKVLILAVRRMLPDNRLRAKIMKHLVLDLG